MEPKLAIDRDRTAVIINSADRRTNRRLEIYLAKMFPRDAVFSPEAGFEDQQLVVARNRVIERLVLPAIDRFQHFVLFDDDVNPDYRTDLMFTTSGDVVGCSYDTPTPNAWLEPTDVHCSAMRFDRNVVKAMKPPYFKFEYNANMTQCLACECKHFTRQAIELGFRVVRAGYAEHGNKRRWCGA